MSGLAEEYGAIGTRPGIERFVEKELGVKPTIVEWFDWERMYRESPDREQMEELFGTDPHRFFLLLPDGVFPGTQAAAAFQRKLRENVPAGAEAEIVLLRQGIVLGKHTYLGVNSLVGAWSPVRIDENVTLSYDTLIGGDPDE